MPTLSEAIQYYEKRGYIVRSESAERVSLVKEKKWSGLLAILTVIGLLAGLVPGLVFGALLVVDYAIKKPINVFLTPEQVTDKIPSPPNPTLKTLVIVGFLLFACAGLFMLGAMQGGL